MRSTATGKQKQGTDSPAHVCLCDTYIRKSVSDKRDPILHHFRLFGTCVHSSREFNKITRVEIHSTLYRYLVYYRKRRR